jgi:hypothetical protein
MILLPNGTYLCMGCRDTFPNEREMNTHQYRLHPYPSWAEVFKQPGFLKIEGEEEKQ